MNDRVALPVILYSGCIFYRPNFHQAKVLNLRMTAHGIRLQFSF
ncbi:hypothetical protein A33Q_1345 [Indibacter alkaliphilus LW1]|uniref:Uncharacterized protein n=1 Tax=Indibacter alkaliphilus (strain CCUG 57479 / KCTC 22604 / LW1) TaxID=1189612 RepID=S2E2J1_INDAL|nr:hypothetical protein A33Q_1345 [Indibacter alkaliphilus LW1]